MSIEAMVDLETFDTAETAVIFQIGVVLFERDTGGILQEHLLHLNVQQQIDAGRTISASTLEFWLNPKISGTAAESLGSHGLSENAGYAQSIMSKVVQIIKLNDVAAVWSKGSFDFNLLENLCKQYEITVPWTYSQPRDLRTMMKECGVPKQDVVSHNALDDCLQQIKLLMKCRRCIGMEFDEEIPF